MKLCNDKITVFNARFDPLTDSDTYVPTVITGVSWFCEITSTVDHSGLKAANKFTIRIPIDADFGGKAYADPASYPTGNPSSVFTLRNGDVVVKGDASSVQDPRPVVLQKLFPDMVTILGVTDNRRAPNAQHWKVVGS